MYIYVHIYNFLFYADLSPTIEGLFACLLAQKCFDLHSNFTLSTLVVYFIL